MVEVVLQEVVLRQVGDVGGLHVGDVGGEEDADVHFWEGGDGGGGGWEGQLGLLGGKGQ